METLRKPFQGVGNIVRFNWHFYVVALGLLVALLLTGSYLKDMFRPLIAIALVLITAPLVISLAVSFYIYDLSALYKLNWLSTVRNPGKGRVININAGFDETSQLLKQKYPEANLLVLDFYDPAKHTEVSIKRARQAYPPYPGTQLINTTALPFPAQSANLIFAIFSAHEIRDENERMAFFAELHRILTPNGQIVITEHLRDLPNFLAYTIGFLHFYSKPTWLRVFSKAAFKIEEEIKVTPFISTFILSKNGAAH